VENYPVKSREKRNRNQVSNSVKNFPGKFREEK
jgi:hypothetical protein